MDGYEGQIFKPAPIRPFFTLRTSVHIPTYLPIYLHYAPSLPPSLPSRLHSPFTNPPLPTSYLIPSGPFLFRVYLSINSSYPVPSHPLLSYGQYPRILARERETKLPKRLSWRRGCDNDIRRGRDGVRGGQVSLLFLVPKGPGGRL